MVDLQREFARDGDLVTEGRDQGTLVFPDAECKIYLTASARERARRRVADLQARGESALLEEVLAQQQQRDRQDAEREVGRLVRAADAAEFATDGLSLVEVVDRLESIVRQRRRDLQGESSEPVS
jgi:cytidylate kinase